RVSVTPASSSARLPARRRLLRRRLRRRLRSVATKPGLQGKRIGAVRKRRPFFFALSGTRFPLHSLTESQCYAADTAQRKIAHCGHGHVATAVLLLNRSNPWGRPRSLATPF